MSLVVHRILRVVDTVRIWPFFREGIEYEAKYLRYSHPIDVYRRILAHLVYKNPNAWVGVAFDGDIDKPIAFVMSHDVTPIYAKIREFEVSMFYYRPGHKSAIGLLQTRLDDFCRDNGVSHYYLSTSSFSSSSKQVLAAWQGLQRSSTVFKHIVK